jgi:hypothetical protein
LNFFMSTPPGMDVIRTLVGSHRSLTTEADHCLLRLVLRETDYRFVM